ncbi:MAG: DUF956 family protein [Lactobacillaceae bacterium]|jgi:hypothetical protein|nr:DUF956 family protein [Lactobacillaceae bacterium]
MAQSLNTVAELTAPGIMYVGLGPKYGKILVGDKAFEFFNDRNVEEYIQIPWDYIVVVYASVHGRRIDRRFKIQTQRGTFDFSSKEVGKVLKNMREHLGDEKVLRMPSMAKKFKNSFIGVSELVKKLLHKKTK